MLTAFSVSVAKDYLKFLRWQGMNIDIIDQLDQVAHDFTLSRHVFAIRYLLGRDFWLLILVG